MDKQAFYRACDEQRLRECPDNGGIGTLGEKTLHAVLKRYFEPFSDSHEQKVGRYVADIVGENGIIEIQTGSFNRLPHKLDSFLAVAAVTVVYPISKIKWLSWLDEGTGEVTKRRKSPKQGSVYDALFELFQIKDYLLRENFHLCIVLLEVEEIRFLNGWSKDRKKGSVRCDRLPLDILGEVYFNVWEDYGLFIPETLMEKFTAKDFSKATKLSPRKSGMGLNVLMALGLLERVGKRGNAYIYSRK